MQIMLQDCYYCLHLFLNSSGTYYFILGDEYIAGHWGYSNELERQYQKHK